MSFFRNLVLARVLLKSLGLNIVEVRVRTRLNNQFIVRAALG